MRRRTRAVGGAVVALLLSGCMPRWVQRPLGDYETHPIEAKRLRGGDLNPERAFLQPGAVGIQAVPRRRGRSTELEVTIRRRAYISVVQIIAPAPDRRDSPVLFRAFYPWALGLQWQFEPGRWIIEGWPELIFETISSPTTRGRGVRLCERNEEPALGGCWVREAELPGYAHGRGVNLDQYIVIASEERIDPYRLAYDLYFAALDSDELRRALVRDDAAEAARLIEHVIAARPGSPFWGAIYLSRQ